MPEGRMVHVLPPTHWLVQELRALGPDGFQTRLEVTGSHPVTVCLFHGVRGVWVQYSSFVPMLGGHAMGRPVVVPMAVMECWPGCGAKIEWRS